MKAAAPMEAQTAQPPSDPSSATYPGWVMLEQKLKIDAEGSFCSTSGDVSKTSAAARTSTGNPIQVSLNIAEPPAVSFVCVQIPYGLDARHSDSEVLAAHGDSVLIVVTIAEHGNTTDHFVYNAGDAAADPPRPPSLCLLPPFYLGYHGTGLLRRGEDEFVVARLEALSSERSEPGMQELMMTVADADLSLFRAGEWSVRRLQIRCHDGSKVPELPSYWNAVIPVGNRLLCWVDIWGLGVVLCDVFEETPKLQYVRLPRDNIWGQPSNRNMCATADGGFLKFVNIFPRCCCGGAGDSHCKRSRHAYSIHTWTMRIGNDDDMEWVKDGMLDATELWALDSYKGLRSFPLDHPVVSMDDPDLICFWLHEPSVDGYGEYSYESVDLLMVNMRSKTIRSVSRHEYGCHEYGLLDMQDDHLIPSNVSYFFNSSPSSGCDGTLTGQRKRSIERPPPAIDDEQLIRTKRRRATITANPTPQPASFDEPSVQASEIFEAFQEIPSYGLDHDEAKVFRILRHDNCRRFRSLLRLPKNLRKDWLLMEIKACED